MKIAKLKLNQLLTNLFNYKPMIKFSEISEQVSEMKLKVIEQLVSMIEQTEDNEIILNDLTDSCPVVGYGENCLVIYRVTPKYFVCDNDTREGVYIDINDCDIETILSVAEIIEENN